jgi:ABC-type transport system involved in Fe-S cluster assembly fused permease/ATPase subunit
LTDFGPVGEVVVLDRGQVVQRGAPADLLREDGLYRLMWEHPHLEGCV